MGYELLEISSVWHYDQWSTYDPDDPDAGLFACYVNTFLKLKAQASGWPKHLRTQRQKDQYIAEFFEREGVQLDPEKMELRPSLRQLSKLCLNSFWVSVSPELRKQIG